MNIAYPVLLVVYYTKLSELKENKTFDEVKKSINKQELIIITASAVIIVFHTIISTVPDILMGLYR